MIGIFVGYLLLVGFIFVHELGHQRIYADYNIKSTIVMSDMFLHGHTYPINLKCNDYNCTEIGLKHDYYDSNLIKTITLWFE